MLNAHTRGSADDFFQVVDHPATVLGIGMKGIGIVAEPGDGDARLVHEGPHARHGLLIDVCHVEVRDARVASICLGRRPAHHLDASEALLGGEGQDFFQR